MERNDVGLLDSTGCYVLLEPSILAGRSQNHGILIDAKNDGSGILRHSHHL
jgi:hypothetical protein